MTRFTNLLAISVVLTSEAFAAPKNWRPVGQWSFDTANNRCATAQNFISGDKTITIGITLRPMSDQGSIQFVVPGRFFGVSSEEAKVRIGQRRLEQDSARVTSSAKPRYILYEIPVSRAELNELATAQAISITTPRYEAEVPTQQLGSPLIRLDRCMSDLLDRWGLDKKDQARIAEYPKPERPLNTFASDVDYPDAAVERSAVGWIEGRVAVSADGVPSNCVIVRSSGHEDLDAATCRVALRPRFKPAVDREGKTMASPFYFRFTWRMENDGSRL